MSSAECVKFRAAIRAGALAAAASRPRGRLARRVRRCDDGACAMKPRPREGRARRRLARPRFHRAVLGVSVRVASEKA
eukprot:30963-Pelagococcus_subviridis.AAC.5